MSIVVSCLDRTLKCDALSLNVRIGKTGFVEGVQGREGDSMTPLGNYQLRWGFYRADRLPAPRSALMFRSLQQDDGWCDEANHPAYNRFIRRPFDASHEKLWREDCAYDVILVMNHNDSPPVSGLGSAVFIHIMQADYRNTLGCVALAPEDMVKLIPLLHAGQSVVIQE